VAANGVAAEREQRIELRADRPQGAPCRGRLVFCLRKSKLRLQELQPGNAARIESLLGGVTGPARQRPQFVDERQSSLGDDLVEVPPADRRADRNDRLRQLRVAGLHRGFADRDTPAAFAPDLPRQTDTIGAGRCLAFELGPELGVEALARHVNRGSAGRSPQPRRENRGIRLERAFKGGLERQRCGGRRGLR
jgi:hypothetical protein